MNILRFKKFEIEQNVVHGISTREFGSMKNKKGIIDKENLESFISFLGLPTHEVCMHQVHSGTVAVVTDSTNWQIPETDALITNKKNIPLCVVVADCLPILFYDPKKYAIGAAHGGRKGLSLGIVENVIEKFKTEFNSDPKDIIVGIGPGIEKKCYEVDGILVDIRQIAIDALINSGIQKSNIDSIDMCTKDFPEIFYSYRGGDDNGRFTAVISLI